MLSGGAVIDEVCNAASVVRAKSINFDAGNDDSGVFLLEEVEHAIELTSRSLEAAVQETMHVELVEEDSGACLLHVEQNVGRPQASTSTDSQQLSGTKSTSPRERPTEESSLESLTSTAQDTVAGEGRDSGLSLPHLVATVKPARDYKRVFTPPKPTTGGWFFPRPAHATDAFNSTSVRARTATGGRPAWWCKFDKLVVFDGIEVAGDGEMIIHARTSKGLSIARRRGDLEIVVVPMDCTHCQIMLRRR